MSAVIERSGGMAICGADMPVLDIVPATVHARCPIHLGSAPTSSDCPVLAAEV